MVLPDGCPLILSPDVLPESSGDGRLVLWLPSVRIGGHQHWDRVGTPAKAEVVIARGIHSISAAATPTRPWIGGSIAGLLRRFRAPKADRSWTLPNGASVEQRGPRQGDLILAWAGDDAISLDPASDGPRQPRSGRPGRICTSWPGSYSTTADPNRNHRWGTPRSNSSSGRWPPREPMATPTARRRRWPTWAWPA